MRDKGSVLLQMNIPKLDELTEYQWEIMNLPFHGRYLVSGPPESGKSSLALHRASMIRRESPKSHLLMMLNSHAQRDYLADGIAHLDLDPYVNIWTRWQINYLRREGIIGQDNTPVPWHHLSEIILERGIEAQFDNLIVDSVQNYNEVDLQVMSLLSKDAIFFASISPLVLDLSKLDDTTINNELCNILNVKHENYIFLNRVNHL
jgi:hypothetical protein